jgi:DNA-binding MarR family transcriptional regulator
VAVVTEQSNSSDKKRGASLPVRESTIRRRMLPIYNAVGYLVRRLDQRISQRFEIYAGQHRLTRAQFGVLAVVSLIPDLEQAELAQVLGYDPATTGVVVGRLERLGLLSRQKSDRSRRGWQLRSTQEGERLADEQLASLDQFQADFLSGLEEQEAVELLRLMSKLLGISNSYNIILKS